jgi:methionyl-tRNA formyltransferase
LFEKCLRSFRELMYKVIPKLEKEIIESKKQDNLKATYTCALNPEDGIIDWNWDSTKIYNLIRALTYPFPGAYTFLNNKKLYLWSAEEYNLPKYDGLIPGKVINVIKDTGIVVLCGKGAVLLKDGQLENRERKTLDKYISSVRITLNKNSFTC